MPSKPKRRKSARKNPPLTRDELLPIAVDIARDISLQNHMALVALRQGEGNPDLARELLVTVYWAYFASDANTIDTSWEAFVAAERGVTIALRNAGQTLDGTLEDAHCQAIESVLRIHDAQLAVLPLHAMERARLRLGQAIESGNFPNIAAMHRATELDDGNG